ncbi:MAG: GNAT family N-acetyltransferase [Pseudomonadota bacterium]
MASPADDIKLQLHRSVERRAGDRRPATGARALSLSRSLQTGRLTLRRPRRSDADSLALLMNDWEVVRWLVQAPYPYTRSHAVDWIAQNLSNLASGREYQFVICRDGDLDIIGHAGLRLDDDRRGGEIGYWLARRTWGEGYASEAAAAVLKFGFEDLQLGTIWATCLPDNTRSKRVLSKLGLRMAGSMTQKFEPIDQTVTCPMMTIDRDRYDGGFNGR